MNEAYPGLAATLSSLSDADKLSIGGIVKSVFDDEELVRSLSEPINYAMEMVIESYPELDGISFGDDERGDSTDYETFLIIASRDTTYRNIIGQVRIPLA